MPLTDLARVAAAGGHSGADHVAGDDAAVGGPAAGEAGDDRHPHLAQYGAGSALVLGGAPAGHRRPAARVSCIWRERSVSVQYSKIKGNDTARRRYTGTAEPMASVPKK